MVAFTEAEKEFLSALNRGGVRFLIVGLSSAALQGAPVVTEDVDLWVENLGGESFRKAVESVGGFYVQAGTAGQNPPMLGPEKFRLFDLVVTVQGLQNFQSEYDNALTIEVDQIPLKILPLDRVILSKTVANRPKDRAVLPALQDALSAVRKRK